MLSFRLVILTAVAGLCLWSLFSLLDNLREPALLRSAKTVVVKGCEPIESEEAVRLCPQLFCQQALLNAKALPISATFQITVDLQSADKRQRLIGGNARDPAVPAGATRAFACIVQGAQVAASKTLDERALNELAAQSDDWQL
jgi:hypothetical protein